MIYIRKAHERGHENHGWLDTHHTFSFAQYHDPQFIGFRSLRVINEDKVIPNEGFEMHRHENMEIISFVLSGSLKHKDNQGHSGVIKRGQFQYMSAGTGIYHSEHNASDKDPVHFLQIWIQPSAKDTQPEYKDLSLAEAVPGKMHLVASNDGRNHSIQVKQDVDLWLAKFAGGETLKLPLKPGRSAWIQVAEGTITLNGQKLKHGDGAAIAEETELLLYSDGTAQVLIFDLV